MRIDKMSRRQKQDITHYFAYITKDDNQFLDMTRYFDSVENIEKVFNIEFACGLKDGNYVFIKDIFNVVISDDIDSEEFRKNDELLAEFDGKVIDTVFRYKGKVYNCLKTGVKFEVDYWVDTGEYSKAKVKFRGI